MRNNSPLARLLVPLVLLGATAGTAYAAPVTIINQTIRGGVSVDATGVSTPRIDVRCNVIPFLAGCNGSSPPLAPADWYRAPKDLQLAVPPTATLRKVYLAITAKAGAGFPTATPENDVRFNGKLVAEAGAPVAINEGVLKGLRVFDITAGFGVTPATTAYSVEEAGRADGLTQSGSDGGIAGEQLVALYEDNTLPQVRNVAWYADFAVLNPGPGVTFALGGLPVCGVGNRQAVFSLGESFECSNEQSGSLAAQTTGPAGPFTSIASGVGGRDDSRILGTGLRHDVDCGQQDYNSLITVGSFGANATGAIIGLDGDTLTAEPRADGSANNSRISDELASVEGSSAQATWSFRALSSGSQWATSFILVSEQDDSDCDGILNAADNCPSTTNAGQEDGDGDGAGNACDNCPAIANANQADLDDDDLGDACDADIDGDGVSNLDEAAIGSNPNAKDSDSDGIADNVETSVNGDGIGPFSAIDTDGDGTIDALDLDSDNDCLPDAIEPTTWRDDALPVAPNDNCPNPAASLCDPGAGTCVADTDNDGIPDATEIAIGTDPNDDDSDGDGITDDVETSAVGNAGPFTAIDTDADGTIDANDLDSDNDCLPDASEAATWRDDAAPGAPNANCVAPNTCDTTTGTCVAPVDTDADGIPDDVETAIGTDPNAADSDGDGIADNVETSPDGSTTGPYTAVDSDGDGVIDAKDLDSDNDCLPDANEMATYRDDTQPGPVDANCTAPQTCNVATGQCVDPAIVDTDSDGIPDEVETTIGTDPNVADSDGDGIPDGTETSSTGTLPPYTAIDTDGDGTIDALDLDSDNDCLPDAQEVATFRDAAQPNAPNANCSDGATCNVTTGTCEDTDGGTSSSSSGGSSGSSSGGSSGSSSGGSSGSSSGGSSSSGNTGSSSGSGSSSGASSSGDSTNGDALGIESLSGGSCNAVPGSADPGSLIGLGLGLLAALRRRRRDD